MPQEAVTGCVRLRKAAAVHQKPQVHHAVACVLVLKVERRVADSRIIGPPAPGQAVAGGQRVYRVAAVVDGQVQRHHAVATLLGLQRMGGMGFLVIIVAAVPDDGVAHNIAVHSCRAVVYRKIEGVHARMVGGLQCVVVIVGAAGSVGGAVPQKAVAGCVRLRKAAAVHQKPQVHHAVACVLVLKVERRVADSRIIGPPAPGQAVAGGQRVYRVAAVVDGQVQRHHAVATLLGLQRMGGMGFLVIIVAAVPDDGVAHHVAVHSCRAVVYRKI